ncbi:MAG: aromatic-ring-hydroxylating dioxygenase subunit beta [Rubrivivax sp.]
MSELGFVQWQALQALYLDCAAALDARELERWPGFFTEDAVYRLQSRENHERGLPLAVMAFESRGMLQDRVYGALQTIYHDPYVQRHILGAPRILEAADGAWRCEASYLVIRTKRDAMPEVLSVGRTLDRIVATPEGLRFAERLVLFDNDLIANSIIDPI